LTIDFVLGLAAALSLFARDYGRPPERARGAAVAAIR